MELLKSTALENKLQNTSPTDPQNQPHSKKGKWIQKEESDVNEINEEKHPSFSQTAHHDEGSAFVTREPSAFVPRAEKASVIKPPLMTSDTSPAPITSIHTGTSKAIAKSQKILDLDDIDDSAGTFIDPDTLFSPAGLIFQDVWNSRQSTAVDLNLLLPNFSLYSTSSSSGNQTLALQMLIPDGSIGWSLSICPASLDPSDETHLTDALFHFNPRYNKQLLVMTDRLGSWGTEVRRSLGKDRFLSIPTHIFRYKYFQQ
jgi:hypothetical protein